MAIKSEYRRSVDITVDSACSSRVKDFINSSLQAILDDIEAEVSSIKDICESADGIEDLDDMKEKMDEVLKALEELANKLY